LGQKDDNGTKMSHLAWLTLSLTTDGSNSRQKNPARLETVRDLLSKMVGGLEQRNRKRWCAGRIQLANQNP